MQFSIDHSFFVKREGDLFMILLIYVDDVVIASNNESAIFVFKQKLDMKFKLKELGVLKFFLGSDLARCKERIFIS